MRFSRTLSSVLFLLLGTLIVQVAPTFSATTSFRPYADDLARSGIINFQSTDAGYRLLDLLSRAESVKMADNVGNIPAVACTGNIFLDVHTSLGDLCGYIESAVQRGIIARSNIEFRPDSATNRAEFTRILLAARGIIPSIGEFGFYDVDSSIGITAAYINAGVEIGCIDQARYFRPFDSVTRGEAFKIASCIKNLSIEQIDAQNSRVRANNTAVSVTLPGTSITSIPAPSYFVPSYTMPN